MRRTLLCLGLSAVVVLTMGLPAVAGGSTNVESPLAGSTVNSSTAVRVTVNEQGCGGIGEEPATTSVETRLTANGRDAYPGSQIVSLTRSGSCSSTTSWGGANLDPSRAATYFGSTTVSMCNGRWRLQARADGGAWGTGVQFTVSRAPAAPTDVSVQVDEDAVDVSWTRTRDPDLVGYRVERRRSGSASAWTEVEAVASSASSATDTGVTPGQWEYRVLALRGDGKDSAPCEDTTAELTTPSAVKTATIADPDPEPSPSPSPGGGATTGGTTSGGGSTSGGSSGGSTGGSTTGETSGGDTTDGSSDGDGGATGQGSSGGDADGGGTVGGSDGSDGSGSSGGRSGTPRRVGAPPPAVRTGPDLSSPELPSVAAPEAEERYYGEDEEYSGELSYGDVEPVEGTETIARPRTTMETRVVPQAVHEFVHRYIDPDRFLRPIAAGLVLVALALHLRRWTREHDAVRD